MSHVRTPARSAVRWLAAAALVVGAAGAASAVPTGANAAPRPAADAVRPGARPDPGFGETQRSSAIRAAQRDASKTADRLRLGDDQGLVARDVTRDADGTTHTRYERTYRGLPVIGGDFVLHRAPNGALSTSFGGTSQALDLGRAARTATVPSSRAPGSGAKQVVYASTGSPTLAWQTRVRGSQKDGTPIDELVFTDARTGKRLGTRTLVFTEDNTGRSRYSGKVTVQGKKSGKVWKLVDEGRGNHKTYDVGGKFADDLFRGTLLTNTTRTWGNFTGKDRRTAAVDAAFGAQETWDYFFDAFGREGIRDDGVASYSRVHFGKDYANAFWSDACFCMTYGDGSKADGVRPLVSLDVAGHEMSHGLTSHTAGLDYFGDAGGLNESTSDVFGTMVEFEANNATDPGDYLIGEKLIVGSTTGLRRMDDPASDQVSLNCWKRSARKYDPHFSSGIGNHAFFLMAEGSGAKTIGGVAYDSPVCAGGAVSGIGRDQAAQIWYRALTTYWTSSTTYAQAADGMVKAAVDLYGPSSDQCDGVKAAWLAVSVAVAADCDATTGGGNDPANLLADPGFELFDGDWTEASTTGEPVVVTDAATGVPAHGGIAYAQLGDDPFADGEPVGGTTSVSQQVTLPAQGETTLSFYLQAFSYEDVRFANGEDPLTVEVNGQPVATWSAADAAIADPGWALRKIAIPTTYRGQTVTLTFQAVTDEIGTTGWWIDDVALRAN